jgi:spore germination cell wall hydrolase CwlJ-like protein
MRTLAKVVSVIVAISALTVMAPGHADEVQVAPAVQLAQVSPSFYDTITTQAQSRLDTLVDAIILPIIDISISSKDIDCLARNIYYEAGSESEEGKVAVAMVTINRVRDGRFGKTICSVVDQRTKTVRSREVTTTRMVQTGWFGSPTPVKEKTTVVQNVEVCQFSWRCMFVHKPKDVDERWVESRRVAEELLGGNYVNWQNKYSRALYFHATAVRPVWARQKQYVSRVGGHLFYADI